MIKEVIANFIAAAQAALGRLGKLPKIDGAG
jgi:hypothetical protein